MPTILAIDDKRDNLTTITALLKNLMPECAVITALSGPEGLEKALAAQPDAVLLDINMPGMDGFETCRRLKADARTQPIPVVMVTAVRSDAPSRIKGLDLGADAFLSKPLDEHELVSQLKVVLRIKAAEDALRTERDTLEAMVLARTAALRASEAKSQLLLNHSSDLIWSLTLSGVFTYASPSWSRITGYDPALVQGSNFTEFVHLDDIPACTKYLTAIQATKEVLSPPDYRVRHADGSWHWHEATGTPVLGQEGEIVAVVGVSRDITERKRAKDALRESEARFRAANNASLDALLLLRSERDATGAICDFVFVDLNRRAEELLRMDRAQLLGKRLCEKLPINREAGFFDKYKRVVDTGLSLEEEFFLPETHVPAAWYYHQVVRVDDGIFICHRDIGERKRAEEALRAREAFTTAVLEALGANIAVLNRRGVITAVNSAWERFARANGDATGGAATGVGADYLGSIRAATGTSTEGSAEALAGIQAVLAGATSLFTIDYPCHSPEQQRWFMLRATPLPGAAGGAVVAHIDVTAHKRAEAALRKSEAELSRLLGDARQSRQALLSLTEDQQRAEAKLQESKLLFESVVEHIPLMIFLKESTDLRFVIFNRAGEELLGYDRKAFLGKNNLDLFPPGQAAHFMAKDREVLDGDVGVLDIPEEPIQTARKGVRLLHTRKVCIRGGDGKTKYLLGISDDITDRVRAQEEREQMRAQLLQAQKLKSIGTLAGGVAHEINNPIMGIMNYAQLILDRLGPDSPVSEFATEIGKETERVATIVRNLLGFARLDKESHRSPARLCDIIETTLSLIRATIRHDQVKLEVDVPADLPQIKCHSQQIQQVIMNLLTNARDALNQRYPGHNDDKVIVVSAEVETRNAEGRWERGTANAEHPNAERRTRSAEGSEEDVPSAVPTSDFRVPHSAFRVRLTVEDHGAGIPEELRERIFDPFFTTKPRDKGTGLGLSISHGIVKDHGGVLSVESEVGQWTRFHLDLPVE